MICFAALDFVSRIVFVSRDTRNRANLVAFCQGSTPNRAKAERALSSIPFLPSQISVKRKLSNSTPKKAIEVEDVI
jgi:hypothetical protein